MKVELRAAPFAPWSELADYEREQLAGHGGVGASAAFVGTMRDYNAGADVTGMHLEHYPGMTERVLEKLVCESMERFGLIDALVIHRTGDIRVGEPIVLVAVFSGHRRESFEACRSIMEALKSSVPFWKKETTAAGARWVEKNTPGY